jgi:hypothetical protein
LAAKERSRNPAEARLHRTVRLRNSQPPADEGFAAQPEDRHLRACQVLLGKTKLESTVRYLGVELDGALEMSAALQI